VGKEVRAMAVYLVSYDAEESDDRNIAQHLEGLGAIRVLESQWLVPSRRTSRELYEQLLPLFCSEDRFLVLEVFRDAHWEKLLVSDAVFRDFLSRNARE
jgi:hypothetical protein